MNRLDRQLAIAMLLQNRKSINAQKIAEYFEISVRTVYRDIQVLSEAGLPIVALPGEGYAIMDGYKLPPLMFDRLELMAIHVGLDLAAKHGDRNVREAAQRARVRFESTLPPLVRLDYDGIVDDMLVHTVPPAGEPFEKGWLTALERSVREHRVVRAARKGGGGGEIHPLLLYYFEGDWLVIAARPEGELFDAPLSSFRSLEFLERKFQVPEGFTFSRYWTSRQPAPVAAAAPNPNEAPNQNPNPAPVPAS